MKKALLFASVFFTLLISFTACTKAPSEPNIDSSYWKGSIGYNRYKLWLYNGNVKLQTIDKNDNVTLEGIDVGTYTVNGNEVVFNNFICEKDGRSLPDMFLSATWEKSKVGLWTIYIKYKSATNHLYKFDGDYKWSDEIKKYELYLDVTFDKNGDKIPLYPND